MSLVAGADGDKSVFKDGIQVDHISENTVGHGSRVKGISDPTTYPVAAGEIGELVEDTSAVAVSLTTGVNGVIASISLSPGIWQVYGGGYFAPTGLTSSGNAWYLSVNGVNGLINGRDMGYDQRATTGSNSNWPVTPLQRTIRISSTQTVSFKMGMTFSGGTVNGMGYVGAVRIA